MKVWTTARVALTSVPTVATSDVATALGKRKLATLRSIPNARRMTPVTVGHRRSAVPRMECSWSRNPVMRGSVRDRTAPPTRRAAGQTVPRRRVLRALETWTAKVSDTRPRTPPPHHRVARGGVPVPLRACQGRLQRGGHVAEHPGDPGLDWTAASRALRMVLTAVLSTTGITLSTPRMRPSGPWGEGCTPPQKKTKERKAA